MLGAASTENMGVLESIAVEIAKKLLDRLTRSPVPKEENWTVQPLYDHLVEVAKWSGRIVFYGLGEARATDSDSIALMSRLPRRFQRPQDAWRRMIQKSILRRFHKPQRASRRKTENYILMGSGNYLLLGDPGAGKTTTLKRIARTLLLKRPIAKSDCAQYPVVIRLRELNSSLFLEEALANSLGLQSVRKARVSLRNGPDSDKDTGLSDVVVMIDNHEAINVVVGILNRTRALVLLDGLDEVSPAFRDHTEHTIEKISRKANGARLIVSCRSGDYRRPLEGLDAIEICPLDFNQIKRIAEHW